MRRAPTICRWPTTTRTCATRRRGTAPPPTIRDLPVSDVESISLYYNLYIFILTKRCAHTKSRRAPLILCEVILHMCGFKWISYVYTFVFSSQIPNNANKQIRLKKSNCIFPAFRVLYRASLADMRAMCGKRKCVYTPLDGVCLSDLVLLLLSAYVCGVGYTK